MCRRLSRFKDPSWDLNASGDVAWTMVAGSKFQVVTVWGINENLKTSLEVAGRWNLYGWDPLVQVGAWTRMLVTGMATRPSTAL